MILSNIILIYSVILLEECLPKKKFYNKSKDIFDFTKRSGVIDEERSDEDKQPPPVD